LNVNALVVLTSTSMPPHHTTNLKSRPSRVVGAFHHHRKRSGSLALLVVGGRRFRQVFLAEEDFAAGRDFGEGICARQSTSINDAQTLFALRQNENPFRQKGPTSKISRNAAPRFQDAAMVFG
jgi:hypothetical protein